MQVAKTLNKLYNNVTVHDPHIMKERLEEYTQCHSTDELQNLSSYDVIIIVTQHDLYKKSLRKVVFNWPCTIIDCFGCYDSIINSEKVTYLEVGKKL